MQSKSILIYRLGSLGDTVIALPCFHRIAETFASAHRIALTNFPVSNKAPALESVLGNEYFIHDSIAYPVGLRSVGALLQLRTAITSTGADTLVYLQGSRGLLSSYRDFLFFKLCGIRHIIGAPLTKDRDRVRIDRASGEQEPEAARLVRCISALGPIDLADPQSWDLMLTAKEVDSADEFLGHLKTQRFIAINTGGKSVEKDWGFDNWTALLTVLRTQIDLPLVFVGGAEDSERAVSFGSLWHSGYLDACGKLSPRETAALLRRASLFVGHDSGPMHLAAAVGVGCVALFGKLNQPRKWYPFGAGHVVLHDTEGVENITVATATAAVLNAYCER